MHQEETNSMYDVAIIGAGIGGLMTAYKIKQLNPEKSIVILDQGNSLENRKCPSTQGKPCAHCKICSISSGYAGAGAFSDGKFNLGTSYGGTLGEEIGDDVALNYILQADDILNQYADFQHWPAIYESNEQLKLKCLQNNLRLLDMKVRHLGTDRNFYIMKCFINALKDAGVIMLANQQVITIREQCPLNATLPDSMPRSYYNIYYNSNAVPFQGQQALSAKNIVIAVGRSGSNFLSQFCKDFGIEVTANAVDIGVRVEMKDSIWREFSSKIYEPKILYKTTTFEDRTRMFCFNQGGIVSAENNNGIVTANGHSYADKSKKTENCNFAILTSINFTEPFNQPTVYASNIASLANMIGDGNVLVQRFGDLIRGRRTNDHRLSQNTVKPTLKATAGDLSLVLPHRILTDIIETIYALNKVAPGTANDDTLLYGCESKYYSVKPKTNENFEITDHVYVVGDCSGICRGLSQSAAMGLYVGEKICKENENAN